MELSQEITEYIKEITRNCYKPNTSLDIFKLLKNLNIEFWTSDMNGQSDLSGAIVKEKDDKFTVYVNSTDSEKRRRFTICHEIGHYISYKCNSYSKQEFETNGFIEDNYSVLARITGTISPAEIEANQIAAEILMPEIRFRDLISREYSIDEIAELFDVSAQAVKIRAKILGIEIGENKFAAC